jgi:prophage antirepressor-like protein
MQLTQFVSETEGFSVRAVHRDEQEWFIAKDVCDVLGIKNSRKATAKLDEDERSDVTFSDASLSGIAQERQFTAVNESGLYALILRSNKPQARAFRKWVTSEVLPSIRKTGGYSVGGDPVEITRMEIERLTRQIAHVGVPEHQAEKAAKAAFRAKLAVMRAAIMGIGPAPRLLRDGSVLDPSRYVNNGTFAQQYSPELLLNMLTEPMPSGQLKERAFSETGMTKSTYQRLIASLRQQGKVRYVPGSNWLERVFEEGGAQ